MVASGRRRPQTIKPESFEGNLQTIKPESFEGNLRAAPLGISRPNSSLGKRVPLQPPALSTTPACVVGFDSHMKRMLNGPASIVHAKCAAMDMKLKLPLPSVDPITKAYPLMKIRERARRMRRHGLDKTLTLETMNNMLTAKAASDLQFSATHFRSQSLPVLKPLNLSATQLKHQHQKLQTEFAMEMHRLQKSRAHLEECAKGAYHACSNFYQHENFCQQEEMDILVSQFCDEQDRPCSTLHDIRDEGVSVVPKGPLGKHKGVLFHVPTETDSDWDPKMLKDTTQKAKDKRDLLFHNLLRVHLGLYRNKVALQKQVNQMLALGKKSQPSQRLRSGAVLANGLTQDLSITDARQALVEIAAKIDQLKLVLAEVMGSSASHAKRYRSAKMQAEKRIDDNAECGPGAMLVPLLVVKWREKVFANRQENLFPDL